MKPGGPDTSRPPGLARRLACLVYEGFLVFGLAVAAGFLYTLAMGRAATTAGTLGLQAWLFVVIGAYFTVCWSRLGQTLAMKTWHIRVVTQDLKPLGAGRAALRYALSWLWFVPALLTLHLTGLKGGIPTTVVLAVGVLAYGALSRLHPQRATLHDAICGTRLIDTRPGAGPAGVPPDRRHNPAP